MQKIFSKLLLMLLVLSISVSFVLGLGSASSEIEELIFLVHGCHDFDIVSQQRWCIRCHGSM